MDQIEILGGIRLFGEIPVQGCKNAALPIMAAAVLQTGVVELRNCPEISDVFLMMSILEELGCKCTLKNHTLLMDTTHMDNCYISAGFGKTMRSVITLAGSMLGRFGACSIPYPGGCVIGSRPIDFHLEAFRSMGVEIHEEEERITAKAGYLQGSVIRLPFPSVGATQNIILAAVLAHGKTILYGAAREPEVVELCEFLLGMGACICGAGTDRIIISGVGKLRGGSFHLSSDRIVAGTYLLAAAGSRGEITLTNAPVGALGNLRPLLEKMGAVWQEDEEHITVNGEDAYNPVPYVRTAPYPGFSTDLQSQLLAVLSVACGESLLEERIFEARFKIVEPLKSMGADLEIKGNSVIVRGVPGLFGRRVAAGELRGGAALVTAGLLAEGKTIIENPHFIDRGYEDICGDLRRVGAAIRRKKSGDEKDKT